MSYKALEDWASLGIGGVILPRSKISTGNRSARPLLLDSGEPAMVRLQVIWPTEITGGSHLEALIEYLNTQGRKLAGGIAA